MCLIFIASVTGAWIMVWLCYTVEGALQKVIGRRLTDRYVFLFDGLIIFTKQNKSRISVTGPVGDYKLKEKYHVRLLDITDRDDTDGKWFHVVTCSCVTVLCRSQNFAVQHILMIATLWSCIGHSQCLNWSEVRQNSTLEVFLEARAALQNF